MMRTINRYIMTDFVVTLVMSLLVFTFIMSIGVVFKVSDLLARGVSWQPIFRILLSGMPAAMMFSIPVSVLTTSLLVFGRLSADSEITAMRASGISLWAIASRPLLLAFVLAVVCLYINNDLAPRSHYARKRLVRQLGVESPTEMLEEGRFIQDFENMTIYVGRKEGNLLSNIRIYDQRTEGIKREVVAQSGTMRVGTNGTDLVLDLLDVRVDPLSPDRPGPAYASRYTARIEDAMRVRKHRKRTSDKTIAELLEGIRHTAANYPDLAVEDLDVQRMSLAVELNKRLVLSLACVAFVMLGVPLGIRAHRKESSIGVAISLLLVFSFYLFIIVAESLAKRPELRSDFIVWVPVLLGISLGAFLIERAN